MTLLEEMPQKWLDYAVSRTGINLPNCFTWACARISWIVGFNQPLDPQNKKVAGAQDLWTTHHENFSQSQTPKKGALMIWRSGQYGHVAVCENDNGTAWSQSNYGGREYEYITGSPKGYCGMTFLGYLHHKNLKSSTTTKKVLNKSNMEEESWGVIFKNEVPITIHKNSSDGPFGGTYTKGEKLHYTHKGVVDGHRWVGWTENGQFYVCAISGSEDRGKELWVELVDPKTFEVKKEEEKKEEEVKEEVKVDYTKNVKMHGCDVSEHNDIDFSFVLYDYAIIRASYGTFEDGHFKTYADRLEKLGIPYGVYVYDYAYNEEGAEQEADFVLNLIKDRNIQMGVWFDMEDADGWKKKNGLLTTEHISKVCKVFCDKVRDAGYFVGIYTTKIWQDSYVKTQYPLWVAHWGVNDGRINGDYSDFAVMHQYSSAFGVDKNVSYRELEYFKSEHVQNMHKLEEEKKDEENEEESNAELKTGILKAVYEILKKILKMFE